MVNPREKQLENVNYVRFQVQSPSLVQGKGERMKGWPEDKRNVKKE